MAFVLILLVARILPFPYPGSNPFAFPRSPAGQNRSKPTLIFNNSASFTSGTRTFNLTLTQSHLYNWRFNVTWGPVQIDLADPKTGGVFWTVGPLSSGPWHINGTGSVNFNWTAPVSGYYSMVLERQYQPSLSNVLSTPSPLSCSILVWDLNLPPLRVIFA
jgi:hypothetical protein